MPTDTPIPDPTATPYPIETRTDEHGIEQVWVPAGTFRMGASEEELEAVRAANPPVFVLRELPSEAPAHEVEITQGFWLDRYEVSNAAFQAFVDAGGYENQEYWSEAGWEWLSGAPEEVPSCTGGEPDLPCANVTWYEAEAYARWRGGRLPTEAEWEWAARGPQSLIYPWGNEWDPAKAHVVDAAETAPVTAYPDGTSWVGAFNMAGNVMEWVQDWLSNSYYAELAKIGQVTKDPAGPETGFRKVEKGGWWGSNPFVARASYRHYEDPPDYSDHHIGFRIVTPK